MKILNVEYKIKKDTYDIKTTRESLQKRGSNDVTLSNNVTKYEHELQIAVPVTQRTSDMLMGLSSGSKHYFPLQDNIFSDQGLVPTTGVTFAKSLRDHYILSDVQYAADINDSWTLLAKISSDDGLSWHYTTSNSLGEHYYDGIAVVSAVPTWGVSEGSVFIQDDTLVIGELCVFPFVLDQPTQEAYTDDLDQKITILNRIFDGVIHVTNNSVISCDRHNITLRIVQDVSNLHTKYITPVPLACYSICRGDAGQNLIGGDDGSYDETANVYGLGSGGSLRTPLMNASTTVLDLSSNFITERITESDKICINAWLWVSSLQDTLQNRVFFVGTTTNYVHCYVLDGVIYVKRVVGGDTQTLSTAVSHRGWHMVTVHFDNNLQETDRTDNTELSLGLDGKWIVSEELNEIEHIGSTGSDLSFKAFDADYTYQGYGQNINIYNRKLSIQAILGLYLKGKAGILI